MLDVSLKDLICSLLKEVVQENQFWPTAISDVADSIDASFSDDPAMAVAGRSLLLKICFAWGGCNFFLPDQIKLKQFIQVYDLYQLSISDPYLFEKNAAKSSLSRSEIEQHLQEQHSLVSSCDVDNTFSGSDAWKTEVYEILKQVDEYLFDMDISAYQKEKVRSTVLLAMSFMKGNKALNVPSCKAIEAELRKKLVYRQSNGKNARQLARKYRITLQHVYRLIKAEANKRANPF